MARWVNRCSVAAMLIFVARHSSAALAIDCTAPSSKIDKAICSTYGVPGQAAELNKDYDEALKMLSAEGQSALRADQNHWLSYRATACGFAEGDSKPGDMHCLIRQFIRRENTMRFIAHQQLSPNVFIVRTNYEVTFDPSDGARLWTESSIPQIDHQSVPASIAASDAKTWNTLIAKIMSGTKKTSACPGGKGDSYNEVGITNVSSLLISVSDNRDEQCHVIRPNLVVLRGSGPVYELPQDHFMSARQYNVVMMRGDVHALEPTDLFLPGDGWKRVLTKYLEQEAIKQANHHREDWHPTVDAMKRVATDPSNWAPGVGAFFIGVNQAALSQDELIGRFAVSIPDSDLQDVLSFKGKRILNARNW